MKWFLFICATMLSGMHLACEAQDIAYKLGDCILLMICGGSMMYVASRPLPRQYAAKS